MRKASARTKTGRSAGRVSWACFSSNRMAFFRMRLPSSSAMSKASGSSWLLPSSSCMSRVIFLIIWDIFWDSSSMTPQ